MGRAGGGLGGVRWVYSVVCWGVLEVVGTLCAYNEDSVGEILNLPEPRRVTVLLDRDRCRIDSPKTAKG